MKYMVTGNDEVVQPALILLDSILLVNINITIRSKGKKRKHFSIINVKNH